MANIVEMNPATASLVFLGEENTEIFTVATNPAILVVHVALKADSS